MVTYFAGFCTEYEQFWQACVHHGVAVFVHEATLGHIVTAGADRFHSLFGRHACSHPMEAMMALLSLIEGAYWKPIPTSAWRLLGLPLD